MLELEPTKPNDDEPVYVIHTMDKPKLENPTYVDKHDFFRRLYTGYNGNSGYADWTDLIGARVTVTKSGEFTWDF